MTERKFRVLHTNIRTPSKEWVKEALTADSLVLRDGVVSYYFTLTRQDTGHRYFVATSPLDNAVEYVYLDINTVHLTCTYTYKRIAYYTEPST